METHMHRVLHATTFVGALACLGASAQTVPPDSFPADALAPPAAELQKLVSGKVFAVKLANGNSWRLEYKANGYFFINTSSGFSDTGEWRTEDGKLCSKGRNISGSCNETRTQGDALLLKRDSGEIVQLVAQ
jgi:hypothetical protein